MSDLDKLREKAQAAPRKNWRLRKSLHGPKYAWVSWGDEAEGLGTADLDVPAARYIAAASPDVVTALIDRLQRVETALREIESAKENWVSGVGSYAGGETHYGFARRLQSIARAALEGGSE